MSKKQTGETPNPDKDSVLQEDVVKRKLRSWLGVQGYKRVDVAMGKKHGADIVAQNDSGKWIIEVKGCGSRRPMRVNYFLAVLGEILQRMNEDEYGKNAKYSIAFPDMKQYRDLWKKLPPQAKKRLKISVLFVKNNGQVAEEENPPS